MQSLGAHSWAFSRRQWLQMIGLQALSLCLTGQQKAVAGAESASAASLAPLNRFPRMVQEYFVERVRATEQAGLKARATLKTRADAEAYAQEVRKKIQRCFGPFPAKTPLNPRVTGTVERDAYKIEKVTSSLFSTPSARANGSRTVTWTTRSGRGPASASTCTAAISSSWSASFSAAGATGMPFAPSITSSAGRKSIPSTSASPATPAAAR